MQKFKRYFTHATLIYGFATYYIVCYLYIIWNRCTFPSELEWMEGGMLAHSARLIEGQAIYTAPSMDFIPFFYTPGYAQVVAWLAECIAWVQGYDSASGSLSFTLARSLSIGSSLALMWIIFRTIQRESNSNMYAYLGIGIYCALFRTNGAFYDLARPDSLLLLLLGLSIYTAYFNRGFKAIFWASLWISCAFLTKQTASVFAVAIALYLVQRNYREGVAFILLSLLFLSVMINYLNQQSNGEFWSYIFEGHQGHIFYWKNILLKYWRDLLFLSPWIILIPLLWFSYACPWKVIPSFIALHWLVAFIQRSLTLDYKPHMYYRELWYESPRYLILIPPLLIIFCCIRYRLRLKATHIQTHMHGFWLWIFIAGAGASALNHSTQWAYSNCFMLLTLSVSFSIPLMLKDLLNYEVVIHATEQSEEQSEEQSQEQSQAHNKPNTNTYSFHKTTNKVSIFALIIARIGDWFRSPKYLLCITIIIQGIALSYPLASQIPQYRDKQAFEHLKQRLQRQILSKTKQLGKPSHLLFPASPLWAYLNYQQPIHTHQMGINDVQYRGGVKDLARRLRHHEWSHIVTHEHAHIPHLARYYYPSQALVYRHHHSLRNKTGFLTRPQMIWEAQNRTAYARYINRVNANFEPKVNSTPVQKHKKHKKHKNHKDLTYKMLGWNTTGQAFHEITLSHKSAQEGRYVASSMYKGFTSKGTLTASLGIAQSYLTMLVRIQAKSKKYTRTPALFIKVYQNDISTSSRVLAQQRIRGTEFHRITLAIPRHCIKRCQIRVEAIDQDPKAALFFDDIKWENPLD
jgi:hypothetical protein